MPDKTLNDLEGIMAIYAICDKCFREIPEKAMSKPCPKCKANPPRGARRFRARVKLGTIRRSSYITGLLADAQALELELKRELGLKQGLDIPRDLTVDEVWQLFARDYAARAIRPYAVRVETNRYHQFLKARFGKRKLDDIRPLDVTAMISDLAGRESRLGKPYSEKTIAHAVQQLSKLFAFAIESRLYAGENPCKSKAVKVSRVHNRLENYLDDGQLAALIDALDRYHDRPTANLIKFLLYTGARRGEALRLEWRDVDLRSGRVSLRRTKSGENVFLPLNHNARAALADQREQNPTGRLVFPNREGRQRLDIKEPWIKLRRMAGLPDRYRVHDLRHSFASRLVQSGTVDLVTIQGLLGHRDSRTTLKYMHAAPEGLARGAGVFDDIVARAKVNREEPGHVADLEAERRRRQA